MSALKLTPLDAWQVWILTGPESSAALQHAELPVPEQPFEAVMHNGNLVAKTGRDEFMAFVTPEARQPVADWCFRRHDSIFQLSGTAWMAVMAQVCQFDFRQLQPGEWQMLAVAGVNCWLYLSAEPETRLLIGCDPGFSQYLQDNLDAVIADVGLTSEYPGGA
ncbi:hypothetical protein [Nitrincola sp.]|uniref:hypothetical protein n=1 Tax=Nitrincola sp. TaxID=1926584 RepID=UPI003A902BB7